MLLQIGLVLVAYYMGRKGMTVQDLYFLTIKLLERDEETR